MITLDYDDLMKIWEINRSVEIKNPLKEIRRFIDYFHMDYPLEHEIPYHYTLNPDNDRQHQLVSKFCHEMENRLHVDECFIFLINSMPKDNKSSDTRKIFEYFNQKYPQFYDELTATLQKQNHIKYQEDHVVSSWLNLSVKRKEDFSGIAPFNFLHDNFFFKNKTLIQSIDFLDHFKIEESELLVKKILKAYADRSSIIEACEAFFERHQIDYGKRILPLFEESEQKLYHYQLTLKANGLEQQFNLSPKDSLKVIQFAAFYLAEYSYYTHHRERSSENDRVVFKMSTPYESALIDAKKVYQEVLSVILSPEFINKENILELHSEVYNNNLAQTLKEKIPSILLKRNLEQSLDDKKQNNKIKL